MIAGAVYKTLAGLVRKMSGLVQRALFEPFARKIPPVLESTTKEIERSLDGDEFQKAVIQLLFQQRERHTEQGTDINDEPLHELSASYLKKRPLLYPGGGGPPLAPYGSNSRVFQDFTVSADGGKRFTIMWQGEIARILQEHARGGPTLPQRNVMGISPQDEEELASLAAQFATGNIRTATEQAISVHLGV